MKRLFAAGIVLFALAGALAWWFWPRGPVAPVTAGGRDVIPLMTFPDGFDPDHLPPGWHHRTFWTSPAMDLAAVTKNSVPALQCSTDDSGSILMRDTDISLTDYPELHWRWFVQVPVKSDRDERTEEGDDQPVRLFVRFADAAGPTHAAEIIWGNRLTPKDSPKVLGTFYHMIADGGMDRVGEWHDESADLLTLFRKSLALRDDLDGRGVAPRLTGIGIFCDTDDTGGKSVAYTADVTLTRAPPEK